MSQGTDASKPIHESCAPSILGYAAIAGAIGGTIGALVAED